MLHPMERMNLLLSTGAVATALVFASPRFAGSVAVGAALEAVNFHALCTAATHLFSGNLSSARLWVALYGARLIILLSGLGVSLAAGADPLGLLLGVSLVVPAVLIVAWRTPPPGGELG